MGGISASNSRGFRRTSRRLSRDQWIGHLIVDFKPASDAKNTKLGTRRAFTVIPFLKGDILKDTVEIQSLVGLCLDTVRRKADRMLIMHMKILLYILFSKPFLCNLVIRLFSSRGRGKDITF